MKRLRKNDRYAITPSVFHGIHLTISKEVINDEEEFNKISADDVDVRQRKERQARLQTEVDRERQKVAQKKLSQLQNRAWDAGKKGPAEQGTAPPRTDKNSFWGTSKVEANGDVRSSKHILDRKDTMPNLYRTLR